LIRLKSAEWTIDALHEKELRNAWENALWINDDWKATDRLTISAGLRLSTFSVMGGSPYFRLDQTGGITDTLSYRHGRIVKSYFNVEPRLSANWRISQRHSLKLGYSRNTQNIHAIRNLGMSMPFDRYTMSSNIIRPQISDQVSLGYIGLTRDDRYEFSAEAYYKHISNVYDYRDGMSFISSINIETLIEGGRGRSYGLEVYARKNAGRLTGWVSYTLSRTQNRIDGINGGRWYTASNDRRHDISIVAMYKFAKTWEVSATWVYNTGEALTAPSAKYEVGGDTYYYFAERNGYRAPAYHRLDFSFTNTKVKRRYTRQWSFGVYNAYDRHNPFIIMFTNDDSKLSGTKTVQWSLFGIIPSVSYSFKF
ncbi:MAG: TonB-dependent receptor, partial [Bacteroidales bacterium]|nr:TonB-dependent receptor [Bacteroidales bacterium]